MGVGHVLGSCQASRGLRAPGDLTHRQPRPSARSRGTQGGVAGSCSPLCHVEGQPCCLDASGKLPEWFQPAGTPGVLGDRAP